MDAKYRDRKNVYANNLKGEAIFILHAESGRKGYYCQGCGKPLEAVRSKKPGRMHFFRHVPVDKKKGERECTYSDETYRHTLAKRLLFELKRIQLPAVYKYPPKGMDGSAMLLKETHLFHAHSAKIEKIFYEAESGEIKSSETNKGIEERYLVVKPDVTFFDSSGKPVLFIEVVATHKVSNEKKVKLRRLGINTVEVRIPQDSPDAIRNSFLSVDKVKWIYNQDEAITEYIPISSGDSKPVLPIDDEQRKLFEETFECRKSQIGNLIRTIDRILESEHYLSIARAIRKEIERVEKNTGEHQSRLDELRERHRATVVERFRERREAIERQRERIEKEERELEFEEADLEDRYTAKKIELDGARARLRAKIEDVDGQLSGDISQTGGTEPTIRKRIRKARDSQELFTGRIEEKRLEIADLEREEAQLTNEFERKEEVEVGPIEAATRKEEKEIERIGQEITKGRGGLQSRIEALPAVFREEEKKLEREFGSQEERIRTEFEDTRRRTVEAVMSRTGGGSPNFAYRIRQLLKARELFNDIEQAQRDNKRNRTAWECFKQGAYQDWIK